MVPHIVSAAFIFLVTKCHGEGAFREVHLLKTTGDLNYTLQPNCLLPLLNTAPLWCPYNYQLLYLDRWTRICKPSACVEMNVVGNVLPELPDDVCLEHINPHASTVKLCRKDPLRMLNDNFLTCPKTLLTNLHYEVQINGSLWIKRDNTVRPLGHYFMFENKSVLICNASVGNSDSSSKIVVPWCVPIPDANTKFQKQLIKSLVEAGQSTVAESKTMSTVCMMASETISLCNIYSSLKWFYGAFATDANQTLIDLILMKEISFGDYFLDLSNASFYYCEITSWEISMEGLSIGSVDVISHICLLITIGLHWLYPKLNYYSRALFCHTLCMCILYFFLSINNFTLGPHIRTLSFLMFSILFICGVSAFLWLNVQAFELWRGFATLKYIPADRRIPCVTRKFLLECLYAYGLAVLLYTIIIFIHFNRNIHKTLSIDVTLTSSGEFQNIITQLLFKGVPLQIILLSNAIFYILTVLNIRRATAEIDIACKKHHKKLLTIFGKLLLIIGMNWVPNLILLYTQVSLTQVTNSAVVNYLMKLFNSFQGVLIFMVYCCNKRTIRTIKKTAFWERIKL